MIVTFAHMGFSTFQMSLDGVFDFFLYFQPSATSAMLDKPTLIQVKFLEATR